MSESFQWNPYDKFIILLFRIKFAHNSFTKTDNSSSYNTYNGNPVACKSPVVELKLPHLTAINHWTDNRDFHDIFVNINIIIGSSNLNFI